MTLTRLDVLPASGGQLTITFSDFSGGYILEEIEGLSPVKASLVTSSYAQQDGVYYQTSRREQRDISIKIGLVPDWTEENVAQLRNNLYAYLMPKTSVRLRFTDDSGLAVEAVGRVESFESALFSSDPVVDINVVCFDPDFLDVNTSTITGVSTTGSTNTTITYSGTVSAGVALTMVPQANVSQITIYYSGPDLQQKSMELAYFFLAGDTVKLNTIPGSKAAIVTRAGTQSTILYAVPPRADWLTLAPGSNAFRVYTTGSVVDWTMTYLTRYGGL